MKAIVQRRYGAPLEVLRLEDVDEPRAGDGEVLVRVRAAGVNALDPRMVRALLLGLLEPIPFGKAAVRREGDDVTLVSVGVGVRRCLQAADQLAADGIQATVLDLRTLAPLDTQALVDHVQRTGRVVVADEDYVRGGLTGEVAALIPEAGVTATYARVAVEQTIPFAPHLEYATLPNAERITSAARSLA